MLKAKNAISYLLFQPLKWIRYFGTLFPLSSFTVAMSTTWNANTNWILPHDRMRNRRSIFYIFWLVKIHHRQGFIHPMPFPQFATAAVSSLCGA